MRPVLRSPVVVDLNLPDMRDVNGIQSELPLGVRILTARERYSSVLSVGGLQDSRKVISRHWPDHGANGTSASLPLYSLSSGYSKCSTWNVLRISATRVVSVRFVQMF